jgi:hypothetical protein
MHALALLEKIFFPVGAAFLSVLGHVHTEFLAKAGKNPPDHALKRYGLQGQSLRIAPSIEREGFIAR